MVIMKMLKQGNLLNWMKRNKRSSVLMMAGAMLMNVAHAHDVPTRKLLKINDIKNEKIIFPIEKNFFLGSIKWSDRAVCEALADIVMQYDNSWFGYALYKDHFYNDLTLLCYQIISDMLKSHQELTRQNVFDALFNVLCAETTCLNINGTYVPRVMREIEVNGRKCAIDWLSFEVGMMEFTDLLINAVNEKQDALDKKQSLNGLDIFLNNVIKLNR